MPKGILIVIISSIALLVFVFGVGPKYQEQSGLKLQEQTKRTQLQERGTYLARLEQLSQQLQQSSAALTKVDAALPPDPELARLLNFLDQASRQSGLLLTEISFVATTFPKKEPAAVFQDQEGARARKPIKKTTVSLKLAGNYPAFKNFLSLLEQSSRLIEVERLSFLPTTAKGFFQFDLTIIVPSY